MTFALITTGGTIDKVYGTGLGIRDLHIGDPVAPEIIRKRFEIFRFKHYEACRQDSLDMTETDRKVIREMAIWDHCDEQRILITHGTDTMVDTAMVLKRDPLLSRQRIVLVGASQPACMRDSDAESKISYALGVLLASREPGVYIAMDGIHHPENCHKTESGIFRSYA